MNIQKKPQIQKFSEYTRVLIEQLKTPKNRAQVIQYLTQSNVSFSHKGETNMHLAVKENSFELFKLAEKNMAAHTRSKKDFSGNTAYDLALQKALNPINMNGLEWFKASFEHVSSEKQEKAATQVVEGYLKNGHGTSKVMFLFDTKAIEKFSFNKLAIGFSSLKHKNEQLLDKLVKDGLDIYAKNETGICMAEKAAKTGNFAALKIFIVNDIDLKEKRLNGKSILNLLNEYGTQNAYRFEVGRAINEIKTLIEAKEKSKNNTNSPSINTKLGI